MDTQELIKKVRRIEIKTKGLSNHIFSGEYHTAFKGRGMSFSEVRAYQYGDDVRSIDWNVTARLDEPHVKVFEEERELTMMLMVDISRSAFFGSTEAFKNQIITEVSAVLSFSAVQNNDKVGIIFFSDKVEKFIPPKKGKSHILRIIRELIETKPESKGTNISEALQFFNNIQKKRSIVFLLSDFFDKDFQDPLKLVKKKHDLVAMQIYDPMEEQLPNIGLVNAYDAETGQYKWLDTSSKKVRAQHRQWFEEKRAHTKAVMMRAGVDFISLRSDESYVNALLKFFKKRI
ncbi:MAG: DUF58 domain-containing protein [Chitinophagales bacterium]